MTDLPEEHRMLSDSLDAVLAKARDRSELWAELAGLGILGLALPGHLGGAEMGLGELVLISRRLGRSGAETHFVTSEGIAVPFIACCATHPVAADIAPRVLCGDSVIALAFEWTEARRASRSADGFRLVGDIPAMVGWADADVRIISAMLEGEPAVFCLPGEAEECQGPIDIPAANLLLHGKAAERALADAAARAQIVTGAFMIGAMQTLFELTVDYLKTRRQFGQPLASFQALQHAAVDMYVELQTAGSMLDYGVRMFDAEPADRVRATTAMKLKINRAAKFVGETAVQLHGGYGMTMESPVGRLFAAVTVAGVAFGDARACLNRLIAT